MHAFARKVDRYYDDDIRERNRVEAREGGILWTWKPAGAAARLRVEGPRVLAAVRSGLYGNDRLLDGPLPEVNPLVRFRVPVPVNARELHVQMRCR